MKKKTALIVAGLIAAGCAALPNGTITKKTDQGNNGFTICVEDVDGNKKCDLVDRKDAEGCDIRASCPGCSGN